jgi:RNA polymerase sigma-70 factor, ECF subfamily
MASPSALSSFTFDVTYINSLRQGDPSTENHFVSHFGPILLARLNKKLRSTDQAWDLHQETFLRVFTMLRSEKEVRHPERFEFFVLGVCNNLIYEIYRQKKRVIQMPAGFDLPCKALSPDACAIADETRDYVWRLLAQLDPNAQAILRAVFLEEQGRDEICRRFGITRSHLRLLIFRAKKMLGAYANHGVAHKPRLQMRRTKSPSRIPAAIQLAPVVMMNKRPTPSPALLPSLPTNVPNGQEWAQSCSA